MGTLEGELGVRVSQIDAEAVGEGTTSGALVWVNAVLFLVEGGPGMEIAEREQSQRRKAHIGDENEGSTGSESHTGPLMGERTGSVAAFGADRSFGIQTTWTDFATLPYQKGRGEVVCRPSVTSLVSNPPVMQPRNRLGHTTLRPAP